MTERTLPPQRVVRVAIRDEQLFVVLEHAALVRGLPDELRSATPAQFANWVSLGDGQALHWVELDFTFPIEMPSLDPDRLVSALRELHVRTPELAVDELFRQPSSKPS